MNDEPLIDTRNAECMTLRDHFAAHIIGHIVAMPERVEYTVERDVSFAYRVADAMMQERAK